ncbi:MAG: hypothetical protein KIG52_04035 [Muribaculaceae bacterium]|nr:hypothetical protein [Muribaculaceae bacterium]
MENEKKSKQPGQQPWSEENQRAFKKMAMLKQLLEEARKPTQKYQAMTDEEVMEALTNGKVIWERK